MSDLKSFINQIKPDVKDTVKQYGLALTDYASVLAKREHDLIAKEKAYQIALQRIEKRNKELESLNKHLKSSLFEALNRKPVDSLPKANFLGDVTVKIEAMIEVLRRLDTYLTKLVRNVDLEYEMLLALRSTLDQP